MELDIHGLVLIITHLDPNCHYQICSFEHYLSAIKSLALNIDIDGTAQLGWGPDWTPWMREGLNFGEWRSQNFPHQPLGYL